MKSVVEPGDFEVLIRGSSRDEDLQKATFTTVERPLQNSIYIRTSYLIINKLHIQTPANSGKVMSFRAILPQYNVYKFLIIYVRYC